MLSLSRTLKLDQDKRKGLFLLRSIIRMLRGNWKILLLASGILIAPYAKPLGLTLVLVAVLVTAYKHIGILLSNFHIEIEHYEEIIQELEEDWR